MHQRNITRFGDYKFFFMLIPTEHEMSRAHKNEHAEKDIFA